MFTLSYTPEILAPYINWAYFFHAWQFPAKFAAVAGVHGCKACRSAWAEAFPEAEKAQARAALALFEEAEAMLRKLSNEATEIRARFALLPCRSEGEDLIFEDAWRLPCLRQQHTNGPCLCLTDFVLPTNHDKGDGINDRVGLFATAAGSTNIDDMFRQTVLDRLAEAAAERMHEEVRRTYWGYAPDEKLTMEALHTEKFQGIRPAVGYPCLPDQRVIFPIARRLRLEEIDITLTETGAMLPHAATCGLLLAHPAARYFSVGEISDEQRCDYENRIKTALDLSF